MKLRLKKCSPETFKSQIQEPLNGAMANEDERHELFIALLGAVDAEDLEVQQQLLNAHPDLLTMSDVEGRTALHRAAGRGVALSLTHLISVSPDLGIANVSVSSLASRSQHTQVPTNAA